MVKSWRWCHFDFFSADNSGCCVLYWLTPNLFSTPNIMFTLSISSLSSQKIQMKMCMYVNFVISYKDAEAQRKGVTLIIWIIDEEKNTQNNSSSPEPADTDPTTLLLQRIHLRSKMHACSMTRASAIHMCTPDTPMCRLRRSLMTNGFGSMRSRIKLHCGTKSKCFFWKTLRWGCLSSNSIATCLLFLAICLSHPLIFAHLILFLFTLFLLFTWWWF